MSTAPEPEFSHPVVVEAVPAGGRDVELSADEAARDGLARRFGLLSIARFQGRLRVQPLAGGPLIRVTGTMRAELAQACVVTLEPVPVGLDIEIEAEFGPPVAVPDGLELTLADAEPHEAIEDGTIDLGELAAQHLLLSLDPYPRAPGAETPETPPSGAREPAESGDNPFAALAALKGRMERGN